MCHASGCVMGCSDNSVPLCLIGTEIEQGAPLAGVKHPCLADLHHMLRTEHGQLRIMRHDLADGQPVDEPAHRGELLLPVRRRMGQSTCLYICHDDVDLAGIVLDVGPRSSPRAKNVPA